MSKNRTFQMLTILLVSAAAFITIAVSRLQEQPNRNTAKSVVARTLSQLPLSFIPNQGQEDIPAVFYTQAPGKRVTFNGDGHKLEFDSNQADGLPRQISIEFVDPASRNIKGLKEGSGIVSYFKGPKEHWKTGIPVQEKIGSDGVWPGVGVIYEGRGGALESTFTVAPNADPGRISLAYTGCDSIDLNTQGELVYSAAGNELKETAPVSWQIVDGKRKPIDVRFRITGNIVGFDVGNYDTSSELIIDPTLTFATYIGGGDSDQAAAVAVDSSGNVYVTGYTKSSQSLATPFPVTGGPDTTFNGGDWDAFVAKFNASGTSLSYAGYIGGGGDDFGQGIAVDASGNAYVTGVTGSNESSFPVTTGPDTTYNGNLDAFVAKVNSSGTSLTYAGYIGGSQSDSGLGIAVDGSGNAYVAGLTASAQTTATPTPFPATVGPDTTYNGGLDGFVAKVNSSGSALSYAGYIGGGSDDYATSIAVDASGNAYVVGTTQSSQNLATPFPLVVGPDNTYGGGYEGFISKINSSGTGFTYSGYIGGNSNDDAFGVAVDSSGSAYVTGRTSSSQDFPTRVGPDTGFNTPGSFDAFVTKVNPGGTGFTYSGFIGGDGSDYGYGITVDSVGSAYVTGKTASSAGFPVTNNGLDPSYNGFQYDAFVAKVQPNGRALLYAGYIGGQYDDIGTGAAVDSAGNMVATGNTESDETTFPDGDGFGSVTGFDQTYDGGITDAWLVKISPDAPATAFDYDGDGKSDVSVFRPSGTPTWYLQRSTAGYTTVAWGLSTDTIVPGDYDGDGKTDVAVYRAGSGATWYRYFMGSGSNDSVSLGTTNDIPAPGDFDADGITDCAVFNNGSWNIAYSGGGTATPSFGTTGDLPAVGDYDGDGYDDVAVYRPSTGYWYFQGSSVGFTAIQWGNSTDKIVQADYDGDGKTDLAVFRPSTNVWYRYFIGPGTNDAVTFGSSGDIPAPGDYDGDGKFDVAIFRPSTGYFWKLESSTGNTTSYSFGTSGDQPTENAYVH